MVAAMVALAVTGAARAAELAYAERTTALTITATSDATANTVVTAGAITADGTSRVCIEVFAPSWSTGNGNAAAEMTANLYDGSTDLGQLLWLRPAQATTVREPLHGTRCYIPTAGSHTYSLRVWGFVPGSVRAGAGGVATELPAFIRVSDDAGAGGGGATELDDLTDVTIVSPIDGAVLKYDESDSQWKVATDDAGGEGSSGPVTLSAGDRERLDLNWWGVWAIVGLLLVLMIAPQLMSVMRITRGMADGRG